MDAHAKPNPIKISGLVKPAGWDRHGNVIQLTIVTENFEKYIIDDNASALELLDFIDAEIEATGHILGEDVNFNKIIGIVRYRPL